jgi:hypothetical protein
LRGGYKVTTPWGVRDRLPQTTIGAFGRLLELRVEVADPESHQGSLDAIDDSSSLANEGLTLAVRALAIRGASNLQAIALANKLECIAWGARPWLRLRTKDHAQCRITSFLPAHCSLRVRAMPLPMMAPGDFVSALCYC